MADEQFNYKNVYDLKASDFNTDIRPTWCSGCGNFGIWNAIKKAFVELELQPYKVLVVFGIGCSGNGTNFLKTYAFHALHGRALPVATGAKLANHNLKVIVMGGDGDGAGIGGNHFMHTCRRNLDMTYIMHDNRVYGLTTGQASPTSDKGFKAKSTPYGVLEEPVNPVLLALSSGATFVARGFSLEIKNLTEIMVQAMLHRGFSFIDVLQPCVTFNKQDTYEYYKQRVYKLDDQENYDKSNLLEAIKKSIEKEKIPIGIFYQVEKPTYEDGLKQIKDKALVDYDISSINISNLLENY